MKILKNLVIHKTYNIISTIIDLLLILNYLLHPIYFTSYSITYILLLHSIQISILFPPCISKLNGERYWLDDVYCKKALFPQSTLDILSIIYLLVQILKYQSNLIA